MGTRCFACDRVLAGDSRTVTTKDGQQVPVGMNCYDRILVAGDAGWRPPKGGPRLYLISAVPAVEVQK